VEESYKEHLEGLLQARSEDIRHGLRPRRRRLASASVVDSSLDAAEPPPDVASARLCGDCGGDIGMRRLQAMPGATLCLDCRRSAERAATPS
jgi:hypothetical protein